MYWLLTRYGTSWLVAHALAVMLAVLAVFGGLFVWSLFGLPEWLHPFAGS